MYKYDLDKIYEEFENDNLPCEELVDLTVLLPKLYNSIDNSGMNANEFIELFKQNNFTDAILELVSKNQSIKTNENLSFTRKNRFRLDFSDDFGIKSEYITNVRVPDFKIRDGKEEYSDLICNFFTENNAFSKTYNMLKDYIKLKKQTKISLSVIDNSGNVEHVTDYYTIPDAIFIDNLSYNDSNMLCLSVLFKIV